MAIIHTNATMSPSKLELLTSWLPAQPWYLGAGREPQLSRIGGFRLDDPQGAASPGQLAAAPGRAQVDSSPAAAVLAGTWGGTPHNSLPGLPGLHHPSTIAQ